jgi:hypothetical protein
VEREREGDFFFFFFFGWCVQLFGSWEKPFFFLFFFFSFLESEKDEWK